MYIFQNTKQRVLDFCNLNGISDELNLCNNGKKILHERFGESEICSYIVA